MYPADRAQALDLLHEYTAGESLRRHAYSVETAMRAYARKFSEDEELWGIVGLIHDFDYERWPTAEDHPFRGMEILRERGCPEEIVRTVASHTGHSGIPRENLAARVLFAVDELCGFILAVAYVRPSRQIAEVSCDSVRKKMKDKAFARQVSREEMLQGAESLGLTFEEHCSLVLEALKANAAALGV